jgi:hypothetical protein
MNFVLGEAACARTTPGVAARNAAEQRRAQVIRLVMRA